MKNVLLAIFISILIIFSIKLYAQSANNMQARETALTSIDALLTDHMEKNNIPGLAIAIHDTNGLVWNKEYGHANLEYDVATVKDSKFRIASVSKLFTGTAILKLQQQGKLKLDDRVSQYVDDLPSHVQNITIRQIAQHSSGIGHYIDAPDALETHYYATTKEALGKFIDRPLQHAPDAGVTYSSFAYTVLAAVIEKITGKEFPAAMDALVFAPLNMQNTLTDDQKKIISGRTGFYQYDKDHNVEHAPYIDLSGRWAGSGYLSTALDLAKFGAAHTLGSDFFTPDELTVLTAPRQINTDLATREGLGWGTRESWSGELMYWGDGKTPGSTCGVLVFPKQNLSIAIVSNMRSAPLDRGEFQIIATRLIAHINKEKISEIQQKDVGDYEFDIAIGENKYQGKMALTLDGGSLGQFNFHDVQSFEIRDAFWKEDELWAFAVGDATGPLPLAMMPIKLKFSGDNVSGDIYRLGAKLSGNKITDNE